MSADSHIYDGTRDNFAGLVLENSAKGPVLVNFWAQDAGPCHRYFPVLAKLARDYAGRFLLVNVNTDLQAVLAREYAVNSVPLVKVFRHGEAVEDIRGYTPEQELRRILDRYLGRESDARMGEAVALYKAGEVDRGLALLAQAALDDPDNLRIPVVLGKLLMAQGRFEDAHRLLAGLPAAVRGQTQISNLLAHVGFIRTAAEAPDAATLEARLARDPADSLARYQLGAVRLLADDTEGALEQLLELVKRDREFRDEAGRRGMLAVFGLLGNRGELVERYRAMMFNALH